MTQILTITNQKGGVGKTTTAAALICGLHQRGAHVLGVDLDPQGNLGFTLGLEIGESDTISDVLKGSRSIESVIVPTEYGDVIPADSMMSAGMTSNTPPRGASFCLIRRCAPCARTMTLSSSTRRPPSTC